jgi:hypothetical protein
MKSLILLAFLVSCSHEPLKITRPHWVEAVRSGEEAMKVNHGAKIFYRRIAGSPDLTKQTACNLVVMKAEEDLKKEYPNTKIPYAVEVLFYDEEHKDCAVTISVARTVQVEVAKSDIEIIGRKIALSEKDIVTEDEAGEIVKLRSEIAAKFALTGLTKEEFEKFAKDKVNLITEKNMCSGYFRTDSYSIHGLTHVCWKGDIVAGYCTQNDKQCWTRTP